MGVRAAINAFKVIWTYSQTFLNVDIHLVDFHFMKENFVIDNNIMQLNI